MDEGQITLLSGMFFLMFLTILLVSYLQMEMVRSCARYVEDALAASGLASALIDVREYGRTHVIRIQDGSEKYALYREALKANLGLDEQWECENKRLISGHVMVEGYVIYNVAGDNVRYCRLDRGKEEWGSGKKGEVRTPGGQVVEKTGVYGEISYEVKGIFGFTVDARRGKLVDIAGEEG